ncbi:hypothetical protein [Methylobacter sp.]|uniref:hypothetical protein n=1 Tax=Methylobacter sp. TaxID=2051955 RepID=UPI002489DD23|nr:hypothetical protein [Methylobacter sp.]MDI1278631.1 hypothetical protein [Methylobacter sp.]MDI1359451.1 hypothetical protein [Methylobacter sp.]
MSAIKLTLDEVTVACRFIVSYSRRKLKQSLADYHDVSNAHYRDMEYCRIQLNQIVNIGSERLQGLIFLFLGNEQLVTALKKFQAEILDDRQLFGSLLITGKHYEDNLLTDVKEVA